MSRFPVFYTAFYNKVAVRQVQRLWSVTTNNFNEPLVDHRSQNLIEIGAIEFVIILVAIVGIVSKRVEHAIAAALASSSALIVFFFLLDR